MIIVHEVVLQARILATIDDRTVVLIPVPPMRVVMLVTTPGTAAIPTLLLLH